MSAYPNSQAARVAGRLSYLSAGIAAAAFDFAPADHALRASVDRVRHMTDAIRFGADPERALSNLRWTETAIREYLPNGAGLAQAVRDKFWAELNAVPAEGLAEIVVKLSNSDKLFSIAKSLEQAAYALHLVSFDHLDAETKGFFGALLDFTEVSRPKFAGAWTGRPQTDLNARDRARRGEEDNQTVAKVGDQSTGAIEDAPAQLKTQSRLL